MSDWAEVQARAYAALSRVQRFNPHHAPAGSPEGGQFTAGEGGGEAPSEQALTAADRGKLFDWLGSGFVELRTDPEFGKVLEKLPKYSGRVYRGTAVTKEQMQKLKVGSIYNIEKYSSSSIRRAEGERFAAMRVHPDKIKLVFEIDDSGRKIPRDMAQLAGSSEETEVVLMRGDRYKITAIDHDVEPEEEGLPFTRVHMTHV